MLNIFLWGGLWVAEVSLMTMVFDFRQLIDVTKRVLVLCGWGPQDLSSGAVV